MNVRRAVGNLENQKREEKFARKQEGDEDGSKRKKGRVGRVKNRRVPKKVPPQKAGTAKKTGGKGAKGSKGKR